MTRRTGKAGSWLCPLALVGCMALGVQGCGDDDSGLGIECPRAEDCPQFPHQAQRMPYEQWAMEWWQWAVSIPRSRSPLDDDTGANCLEEQDRQDSTDIPFVIFLAGHSGDATGPVNRTCGINSDQSLFFPIINTICMACRYDEDCEARGESPGCPADENEAEVFAGCGVGLEDILDTIYVEVDGVPIPNIMDYIVDNTTPFQVSGPADESERVFFCTDGSQGPRDVVARGIFMFLNPLSEGQHTVEFYALATFGLEIDVRYNLMVTAP